MALDQTEIRKSVKNRIYQSGLGQKPSIRQTDQGTAAVTDDVVVFDMLTGEGDKLRPGQTLSTYNGAVDAAYGFYVLSVATDTITCANGDRGPVIPNSTTLPQLLEHQADVTEAEIDLAIGDIIDSYLFPELFDIVLDSFTPSMASLQSDADPLDREIIRAWQAVGPTLYQVPIKLVENMPTGEFSSGKMLVYDVRITTDVNYSSKRNVAIATSTGVGLEALIARGAAAICIEGIEGAPTEEGGQESRKAWASFYNTKRQMETALAKESVTSFKVDRG